MWTRTLIALAVVALAGSCASGPAAPQLATGAAAPLAACPDDLRAAAAALAAFAPQAQAAALDGRELRLLNWNIHKGAGDNLPFDLLMLQSGADLVLLQEAVFDEGLPELLSETGYPSLAAGYRAFGRTSGSVTASRVAPLQHCSLQHPEPWLRSPKATVVARYALRNTDATLLVINTHIVNFTLGLESVEQQLQPVIAIVAAHDGPVIVSGDFNTWRAARLEMVDLRLRALGLQPVAFSADYRKRFLGYALDHVYVRSLRTVESTTLALDSSDHNPLLVSLELAL